MYWEVVWIAVNMVGVVKVDGPSFMLIFAVLAVADRLDGLKSAQEKTARAIESLETEMINQATQVLREMYRR